MRYRDEFNDPDEFCVLPTKQYLSSMVDFSTAWTKNARECTMMVSANVKSMAQLIVPDYLFFGEEAGKISTYLSSMAMPTKESVSSWYHRHSQTLQFHSGGKYAV